MQRRPILIIRSLAAVLGGYVLLAVANMAFVIAWFVRPLASWGPIPIAIVAIAWTFLAAFAIGYLAAWVAGRSELGHALVLVGLTGAVIVVSLIANVAVEPQWYKGLYLAVMIPATLFGAHRRLQRKA